MLLPHSVIFVGGECTDDRAMRVPSRPGWRDESAVAGEVDALGPGGRVLFVGGDPLEHPRWARIIGAAVLAGISQIGVHGPLCCLADPERRDHVVRLGVAVFATNLYAPDAAGHDAVSGRPGGFERTVAALRALHAIDPGGGPSPKPILCVRIPVWAGRPPAVAETTRLAFDLGAESVRVEVRDRVPVTEALRGELREAFQVGLDADLWVSVSGVAEADLGEHAAHQAGWLFPEAMALAADRGASEG